MIRWIDGHGGCRLALSPHVMSDGWNNSACIYAPAYLRRPGCDRTGLRSSLMTLMQVGASPKPERQSDPSPAETRW